MEEKIFNHNIKHLAIIMDGNARWASQKGLSRSDGHQSGARAAKNIIQYVVESGIPHLTLYTFSSENWQRSSAEISFLLRLFSSYLDSETKILHKNGIRLKVIGKSERLGELLQKKIADATDLTKNNNVMTLYIAFGYGGRLEITDACQKMIDTNVKRVTEEVFREHLYDPEMPDVDLLIRSGDSFRISNFLIWQAAYAELFFSKKYWPDFGKDDLFEAIEDYSKRRRTFGSRV